MAPLSKRFPALFRSGLLRHAFVYLVGDLAIRAGSLILVPVYTRKLTFEDYGGLAVATLVATIVSYLASVALSAAVIKLNPEFTACDRPKHVADNIGRFAIVWGALVCGLLFFIVPSATSLFFNSADLVAYNRVAVVTGCMTGITTTLLAVFQSNQESIKYRLVTVSSFIANVATGLVAVLLLKLGGYGAVMGQLVGAGCGFLAAVVAARVDLRAPFDGKLVRRAIKIGIPLTVYSLGGFSTDQLSRIFIERYVSAAALGPYNIAFLYCTSSLALVFSAINTAWVPQFFELKKEESAEHSGYYGTTIMIAAICLGGVMIVLAPIVIHLIGGRHYLGAVDYVPLLMINAIVGGPIWSLFMNPLMLAGRNWCIAWCAVVSGACNVGLNIVLTPRFGVWGAGLSSMLSLLMLTVLVGRFSVRAFPVVYDLKTIVVVGLLVAMNCVLVAVADLAGFYSHALHLFMALPCVALAYWALGRHWAKIRRSMGGDRPAGDMPE